MTDYDYPNESYTGSFIIFNPSQTTPPVPDAPPHSGAKFAACFNAILPDSNDDWLITPLLNSISYDNYTVSFWARSYTDAYNLDRFQVGISTTDPNPSNFTIISSGNYIEAPIEWTQYTYDLSGYSGNIYLAIHCVSYDSFILMVDDFMVSENPPPVPEICCEGNLVWDEVTAGSTVNGTFEISNCGEEGSLLNWQFQSAPNWPGAIFEIEPDSGHDLAAGDSVTITVQVKAPTEKKQTFTGKIKMINSDNASDFCEIDVSLTTPRAKIWTGFNLLQRLLERFPNAFPILRQIMI